MRRLIVKPFADWDVRALLHVSRERFGSAAQRRYDALIRRAYKLLQSDPQRAGVAGGEIYRIGNAPDVFLFHVRHARGRGQSPKRPRHIIVFTYDDATLTVLRVLHDSMDINQHLTDGEES
jgi:plasmid stabilization system protein ParE